MFRKTTSWWNTVCLTCISGCDKPAAITLLLVWDLMSIHIKLGWWGHLVLDLTMLLCIWWGDWVGHLGCLGGTRKEEGGDYRGGRRMVGRGEEDVRTFNVSFWVWYNNVVILKSDVKSSSGSCLLTNVLTNMSFWVLLKYGH